MRRGTIRLALGGLAAAGALAVPAQAAAPAVVTGPATTVTATTATLTGTVSPNGEQTTYRFEYGPTTTYGTQTPVQGPIQGNGDRSVTADVTGLAPSTTYHYRLVATNPSGTVNGADATFTTPAPGAAPPALTATSNFKNVTFGLPVIISGALTGPGNAGVALTLEQNPAPYTGAFKSTGLTTTTDATGHYSFTVTPALNTRYRVTENTKKPTVSNEVGVRVKLRVTLGVNDRTPTKGQRVRFSGSVYPAHDGKVARLQRRTSTGHWRTIATRTLKT